MKWFGKRRSLRRQPPEPITGIKPKKRFPMGKKLVRIANKFVTLPNIKVAKFTRFQLITWGALGVYTGTIFIFLIGPYFRISTIGCQTSIESPCPDFVIPELEKFKNTLSYVARFDEVTSKLLANIPQAEDISIQTVWPNKIEAFITMQHELANLSIPASTSAYVVSSTGQLVAVTDTPNPHLPTIIASSAADLIISDQINNPSLTTAINMIKALYNIGLKPTKIDVLSDQDIEIAINTGKLILVTSMKPVATQVHALQLILSQSTMSEVAPIIDIRYDRPVLKQNK